MTERFTLGVCESGLGLTDNETKEQYLEVDDTTLIRLCEVLNGLSEENEQLKEQWKEKRHEDINELSVIAMKYKALEKENEQLKKIIQKYYDTTNSNGKQLISDLIDCFEMEGLNVSWVNKE